MVCPCGQEGRGLSQCEHFADKGRVFFAILCEHLLWTVPNSINFTPISDVDDLTLTDDLF